MPEVSRTSDLATRALVGAVAAAVALAALAAGGAILWGFVAIVAAVALAEWCALAGCGPIRTVAAVAGLATILLLAAPLGWGAARDTVAALAVAAIVVSMVTGSTRAGWGLVYAGGPALGLLALRAGPTGFGLALWPVLIVILTDTGAYFAGRAIGGPKLLPRISPNKTWAGLAGGVVAATVGGAIVARLFGLPGALLWLGGPMAVLAQGGDLYESALKRAAGVKNSGGLLPGHGGVLDRIDGLVPVAALTALLVAGGFL